MIAAGWARDTGYENRPGFQVGPVRRGARLCHGDSLALNAGPSPAPNGGTNLVLFAVRDRRFTECPPPEPVAESPGSMNRRKSPIPYLKVPVGGVAFSGGSSGSDAEWQAHVCLTGEMTAGELLDHYGGIFRTAGWSVVTEETASLAAVASVSLGKRMASIGRG